MNRYWPIFFLLGSALLLLTGCSDFVGRDQPYASLEDGIILEAEHPVGQTFVSHYAGLDGIEVFLRFRREARGEIRLHLRADPQATEDLATSVLPLSRVAASGFYRFSFEPLPDSHQRYYYAFLEAIEEEQGAVQVGTGPGEAYPDGALYRDHEPVDVQMAFRLSYNPRYMLLDLGGEAVGWLGILLAAGLLYVVPGWALLAWLWPGRRLSWIEGLGFAIGLSLALYPVLLLWTDLAGLHLGPLYAWLPALGGLAALFARYRPWQLRLQAVRRAWQEWARSEKLWPDLTLVLVAGLALILRLLIVRDMSVPRGSDSYHHAVIAQLIVDHGGLFASWEPYAPLRTFTYHFGFHADVAVFHWLTGIEVVQALIQAGQIFNWLAVLVLAPLAVRVSGNRWAGAVAVLLAGLLSPMPMYYLIWGRYVQLAGQVILPVAALLTWEVVGTEEWDWRLAALTWITVGGLGLTHYRVLIFYIFFVVAWLLTFFQRTKWRSTLLRIAWAGIGVVVLFLPQFAHIFTGKLFHLVGSQLAISPSRIPISIQELNAIGDLSFYLSPVWWLTLPVAVGVGLWQHRREVLLIALWWSLLFIITNPNLLHLPGAGIIRNVTFFITVYIPAGVLIGYLLARLMSYLAHWPWSRALIALALVGIGFSRAWAKTHMIHPDLNVLVTRTDLGAMAWIREHTPLDAKFLINFVFVGEDLLVGSDGGWWIPLLAERENTVPPLICMMERGAQPDYRRKVKELAYQIRGADMDDPAILTSLRESGITHVYVGQKQGQAFFRESGVREKDVLDPEALHQSSHYRPVYHQDRVWIFEVMWGDSP